MDQQKVEDYLQKKKQNLNKKQKLYLIRYFPRNSGLIGLQNLGNTCYMNAALQALSNCPQLTSYMIENFENIKPGLAHNFASLLYQIWIHGRSTEIPSKNFTKVFYDYLSPSNILYGVKSACPNFRSPAQQEDAQEFLRCFLDQIHEELKIPVLSIYQSSDNVLKSDNYGYEQDVLCNLKPNQSNFENQFQTLPNCNDVKNLNQLNDKSKLNDNFTNDQEDYIKNFYNCIPKESKINKKTVVYQSIVSKVFNGQILNSVQCLSCKNVSTIKETFQDLSLPIPNKEDLIKNEKKKSQVQEMNKFNSTKKLKKLKNKKTKEKFVKLKDEDNVQSKTVSRLDFKSVINKVKNFSFIKLFMLYINYFFNLIVFYYLNSPIYYIQSSLCGPSITLNNCLEAFFSTDELKDNNMYSCEKCKKLRNGIKYINLIKTPEILSIHFKRFRTELMFSSKISTYVSFPLKGLNMYNYMLQKKKKNSQLKKNSVNYKFKKSNSDSKILLNGQTSFSDNLENNYSSINNTSLDFNCNYSDLDQNDYIYDLVSVICHSGHYNSGHYITYALNCIDQCWYEYDDKNVRKVDESRVSNCEAYVLFYKKSRSERNLTFENQLFVNDENEVTYTKSSGNLINISNIDHNNVDFSNHLNNQNEKNVLASNILKNRKHKKDMKINQNYDVLEDTEL